MALIKKTAAPPMPRRIQAMALALNTKLPSDAYASADEWFERQSERLKDGGFTIEEIKSLVSDNLAIARTRDDARARFTSIVDARMEGVDSSGRNVLLQILDNTGEFISLRPTRQLGRRVRMIKHRGAVSKTFRAYARVMALLISYDNEKAVQAFFNADPEGTKAWGEMFGFTWWRTTPESTAGWYTNEEMTTCDVTGLSAPTSQMISLITHESGFTSLVHPNLLSSPKVRRDPCSGLYILTDAVQWVTLDTGELVWRRQNEATNTIFFDEDTGIWSRSDTRGAVAGYHSARRDWRSTDPVHLRGKIGVELECGFKSMSHLEKFLRKTVDERGRFIANRPFIVENDSSLVGITGGVEIISEPLNLYEGYQAPDAHWRWLLAKLYEGGAEGWKHRHIAGIHVNMDVQGRPASDILRFVALINNAASISRFIAGRKGIYGQDRMPSTTAEEMTDFEGFRSKDANVAGGGYQPIRPGHFASASGGTVTLNADALRSFPRREKYQPVHIRPGGTVLEVRIFGSNIRYEGFMACVEYCVAGMAFVTQLESDSAALHPGIGETFREWLAENTELYPNLVARLGAQKKGSSERVAARPLLELVG